MARFMRWWYHDRSGRRVFQHYRITDPSDPRDKRYGYRYLVGDNEWNYTKPARADGLLYGLPRVLANREAALYLTEGERDADALLRPEIALASCHHGGAGKFTKQQAESLARHRGRIVLVADNDPAGAYDVCRRYDLLRAVGISAKRLRVREVCPSHDGADLRDHLEAGYGLRDLRPADLDRLRDVAEASTGDPSEGSWARATPEEIAELKNWRPTLVTR